MKLNYFFLGYFKKEILKKSCLIFFSLLFYIDILYLLYKFNFDEELRKYDYFFKKMFFNKG